MKILENILKTMIFNQDVELDLDHTIITTGDDTRDLHVKLTSASILMRVGDGR